jgi:2-polyprenyl-3-methyl-5-hydroxy-6-metoxy-1,4-benzoquinol methylase/Pyruvate/2-oxoacid:ferredoxin oxidoreductase delta subunit
MFLNKKLFQEVPKLKLIKKQYDEIKMFKNKVDNKEYYYENINCQICTSPQESIILSKYDRYGLPYVSNFCQGCGLIYTSPRFTQESYIDFYDKQYRTIYELGDVNSKEEFFNFQIKRGEKILKLIKKKYNQEISSVLEVGCGMGGILYPFKKDNCEVVGVDFGTEYIDYGKSKKNLNLKEGGIEFISENKKFDLIIYSHVFEHILDLNNELSEIKKRLTKNGVVYIEVPGVMNLNHGYKSDLNLYFQNAHTFNFSLLTLKNIMNKNGLSMVYGDEKVESLFCVSTKKENPVNDFKRIKNKIQFYEVERRLWWFTPHGLKTFFINILKYFRIFETVLKIKHSFLK